MTLKKYIEKRNFDVTSEPQKSGKSHKKTIFVIQHHHARREHYDFRLEFGGVLLSWAIPKGMPKSTKDRRLAVKVEDHPISYAKFSGTIPKGEYGAGEVEIFDSGTYEQKQSFKSGLKNGVLKFTLHGEKFNGGYALVRTKLDKNQDNWLLIKEKNQNNPFKSVNVELAKLLQEIPKNDEDYAYEVKFDGYRIVAFIENGIAQLKTRNNLDFTSKFESIANSLQKFFANENVVLDGEIVVFDEKGRSDFKLLHNYLKGENLTPVYAIFDILAKDGEDFRENEYIKRKSTLENTLKNCPENILYVNYVIGNGNTCFEYAQKNNLEGIIGKLTKSKYIGDRNGDWIKIKCKKLDEFVVGGYTLSQKNNKEIGALLVGKFKNGKLEYFGKVGSGFDNKDKITFEKLFKNIGRKTSPFVNYSPKNTIFLSPKTIIMVEYSEYTEDNILRHPSFKGLRKDKEIEDVKVENDVKNGDKVYYPKDKITKQDVFDYYKKVENKLLLYTKNRFLSVIRCPNGINGECFFQKHIDSVYKGIGTKKQYFYLENSKGIESLVSIGALEFHICCYDCGDIRYPDTMVFDLDPGNDVDLDKVRECAKRLKNVLQELGLTSFLKTSGGKGYHIVVPLKNGTTWKKFEKFCRDVALIMENKWPKEYTTSIRKEDRRGKIFIDYLRNKKGQTSVAPYSLRARDGAPISAPILWSELDKIAPNQITIKNIDKRLNKDVWKNYFDVKSKQKIR